MIFLLLLKYKTWVLLPAAAAAALREVQQQPGGGAEWWTTTRGSPIIISVPTLNGGFSSVSLCTPLIPPSLPLSLCSPWKAIDFTSITSVLSVLSVFKTLLIHAAVSSSSSTSARTRDFYMSARWDSRSSCEPMEASVDVVRGRTHRVPSGYRKAVTWRPPWENYHKRQIKDPTKKKKIRTGLSSFL